MLGFPNAGSIAVKRWNSALVSIIGSASVANVHTHVTVTYSILNGLNLWINGTQHGVGVSAYTYSAADTLVTATLSSSLDGDCIHENYHHLIYTISPTHKLYLVSRFI